MNVGVIIAAAGRGERFGRTSKLDQEIGGRALVMRTVELFTKREEVKTIVVAGSPETFDEFKSDFDAAVKQEKKRAAQETFSQGLANTTAMQNTLLAIEKNANNEMEKTSRAHSHAVKEITQLNRAVNERSQIWWKKLLDLCGLSRE